MIDNPLGPAMVSNTNERFFLAGKELSEAEWRQAPDVLRARPNLAAGPVPDWLT